MRQPDRRGHVGARRQREAVHAQLASQAAPGERDHRAQAQRLGDHRPQVGLLAGVHLGTQAHEGRRVAQKKVEGPGKRRRRGLVAGEQQGHELVAKLRVAHRLAVLEAGRDQQREDVLAACQVRVGAPLGDLGGQQLVDLGQAALQRGQRVGPPEAPGEQDPQLKPRRGGLGEQVGEQGPEPGDARWVADAEDGAQDHLERQRLHARVDRECLAGGPGVDLAGGELRDDPLVGAHPLTVERGKHQPPPREVLVALEQQDRARAPGWAPGWRCAPGAGRSRDPGRAPGSPRGRTPSPSASESPGR